MKLALTCLAVIGSLATHVPRAHAIAACYSNQGLAPAADSELPTHARLMYFTDGSWRSPKITATIEGKPVKLTVTELKSTPYRGAMIEVDSASTGKLVVSVGGESTSYTVSAKATMPKELPVVVDRFHKEMPHSTVKELYDGLAIRLAKGTAAVSAHVRIRRDAKAAWSELDVPVTPRDFDDDRPLIRIGQLGCTSNYNVDLLAHGVDLEISVVMADGSKRTPKDLATHVTLPPKRP